MTTARTAHVSKPLPRPKPFGELERRFITGSLDTYLAHSQEPVRWLDLWCRDSDVTLLIDPPIDTEGGRRRNREVHYQAVETPNFFNQISPLLQQKLQQNAVRVKVHAGSLDEVVKHLQGRRFEVVTVINMLHELPLAIIPSLFIDLLALCAQNGSLLVHDLSILKRKVAATPWLSTDAQRFLNVLARQVGIPKIPTVRTNRDKSENETAWYFTLYRDMIPDADLQKKLQKRVEIELTLQHALARIFRDRKESTHKSLEDTVKLLADSKAQRDTKARAVAISEAQIEEAVDMLSRNFWAYDAELLALRTR